MDTAELLDTLEESGLSQYQAEAYTTLLQLGASSATELAEASNVPTARIYDVLRDLETKGYIETYEQESLHARARQPEQVLADLRGRAEQLTTAAEEIERRWEEPEVDRHMVSIVKRFDTVFSRAESLLHEAENEVLISCTPRQFRELRPTLSAALDRDVIVKLSIHTGPPDSEFEELPPVEAFEGVATEVRHRELPTPFVAIVDRTRTCFAPHVGSLNQYGVLVDDYTLTYVFQWYFKTCLWEVWDVLYSTRSDDPPMVYADVRRCVRDIKSHIESGRTILAHVRGFDIETGDPIELAGEVTEVLYSGMGSTTGTPPLSQLAGHVSLTLQTEENVFSVGGWGAVLEDVEATRITIEAIEP